MAESAAKSNIVRFGLFELDLQARELRKSGIRIKLQEQPFQILSMLLERPGEIVTREELQKRLWPEDTFVDFDLSLNSAVKKLRQALNDDSENPRFIETLYRRGYRFIGSANGVARFEAVRSSATLAQPPPIQPKSEGTVPSLSSSPTRHRRLFLLFGTLLLLGLAAVVWLGKPQPPRVLGYTQITHDGRLRFGTVTDGERLYFSELDGDHVVVAQVSAGGGETAVLSTPFENVFVGDISPDGSALLVSNFKGTGPPATLWSLPLPAGTPRRMGDLAPMSAAWSPDGGELVFSKDSEIYLAKSDGTAPHKLATAHATVFNLRFSPDGKRLRFEVHDSRTASSEIWEVKRDGTGLHSPLSGWNPTPQECWGNWTRDGKYYVFQSFRKGANNIWALAEKADWFGRHAEPVQLTNGPLDFSAPVPSKDGKRIFSYGSQPRDELLRLDPKVGLVPFWGGSPLPIWRFPPTAGG